MYLDNGRAVWPILKESKMSQAAKNLVLLAWLRTQPRWNAGAEELLHTIAANLISGNY